MSHWTHFITEEDINASNPKAEWKEFLDSLPAWQRQWDEAPLRRLKERRDAELCRNDIPVPEGFDEGYDSDEGFYEGEEVEDDSADEQEKDEDDQ